MSAYLIAFAWGICLLLSFVGWGTALNRLLFPKEPVDWGLRGAWGLALAVCIGGSLNLVGAISRGVILTWTIAGLAFWLFEIVSKVVNSGKPWRASLLGSTHGRTLGLAGIVVWCLAALHYAGWVFTPVQTEDSYFTSPQESSAIVFNIHDDFHAYFVFPQKMIATGSLGEEPFSERRLNALGGQSFLQTFVLAVLSEENLHLLEPGVALVLVLGLLLGYLAERGIHPRNGVFVLLTFLLAPLPYMNISALVTGMVLFIALFRTLVSTKLIAAGELRHAAVAALCAAAICSLKSSLLPVGAFLLGFGYLSLLITARFDRRLIRGAAVALALTVLFVLPWMLAMYDAFGTPLYPEG